MMRRTDEQQEMMSDAVGGRRSLGRSVPSIPTVGIIFDLLLDSLPVHDTLLGPYEGLYEPTSSCTGVRAYAAVPTSYSRTVRRVVRVHLYPYVEGLGAARC